MIVSLFQTASGEWHLPSILTTSSWLLGSLLTGFFIFSQLAANRDERVKTYEMEQQKTSEINNLKKELDDVKTGPIETGRLRGAIDGGNASNDPIQ